MTRGKLQSSDGAGGYFGNENHRPFPSRFGQPAKLFPALRPARIALIRKNLRFALNNAWQEGSERLKQKQF